MENLQIIERAYVVREVVGATFHYCRRKVHTCDRYKELKLFQVRKVHQNPTYHYVGMQLTHERLHKQLKQSNNDCRVTHKHRANYYINDHPVTSLNYRVVLNPPTLLKSFRNFGTPLGDIHGSYFGS